MAPIAPALAIGLTVASTAAAVASTLEQQKATKENNERNAEQARRVAEANKAIAEQEALDRKAVIARQTDAYSAAIRTTGEARGTLATPNTQTLQRSLFGWAARENSRVGINLNSTKNAIESGAMPNYTPTGSPALAAFGGALGGLQTGLGLGSSLQGLNAAQQQLAGVKSGGFIETPLPSYSPPPTDWDNF